MELELTFVTAKLSLSKFALSSSLARTPVEDALFAFIEAFSFTEAVSATASGPTPVTVMTKFTVLVAVPVSYTHLRAHET